MKQRAMFRGSVLSTVLLGISAGGAVAMQDGGPPSAAVRVGLIEMRPVDLRATATGEARATQRSRVASREPGRVHEVRVREGDRVKRGDILVTLDDDLLKIDLVSERATLDASAALLSEAESLETQRERDLSRLEELFRRQSATENEVADARSVRDAQRARVAQRRAEVATAQSRIARLEERLADMTVRAPFNGRVTAKLVDEGEWAGVGAPVIELVTTDTVDFYLDVPQRYINALESSEGALRIRVEAAGVEIEATKASVVPVADAAARTFPVRVEAPNDRGLVHPGMTVVASIPTGVRGPAMLAPADALLRDDAGWFVYTATPTEQGRIALPARVEQLFRTGEWVAIRVISGPAFPGAAVVVEGNERILFPGQPLMIVNPETLDAPPPTPGAPGSVPTGGVASGQERAR